MKFFFSKNENKNKKNKMSKKMEDILDVLKDIKNYFAEINTKLEAIERIEKQVSARKRPYLEIKSESESESEDEEEILRNWIISEWGDCASVRVKIDNEGKSYFYESYTRVPVSRDTYYDFANMPEDECFCHQSYCENYNGSEEEEEK